MCEDNCVDTHTYYRGVHILECCAVLCRMHCVCVFISIYLIQNCVASLKVLVMANDVTTSKSLCRLAWKPHGGKALAVPVGAEVKIYERLTWKPKCLLKDDYHQKVIY